MRDVVDASVWDRPLIDVVRFNPAAWDHSLIEVPAAMEADWPLKKGFACLVDHVDRTPVRGAFEYLLSHHDGASYNPNTNRTYAYALKPTFETLMIEGRPWEYLDDEVMTTMVSALLDTRGRLGEPLSGHTIQAYVETAARCADYTNEAGMSAILLDTDTHVARGWHVASMRKADGKRADVGMIESARRQMIRPLSRAVIERIEGLLLMDPAKWHPDGPSSRPGLTFSNGRRNGLRLIENLGLLHDEVMRPTVVDHDREYLFEIFRTKGGFSRTIFAFGRDIVRWQRYVANERKACVAEAKRIHGNNWDEPEELLVNGLTSGVHVGRATQPSSIQHDFRRALDALGMFDDLLLPDGHGGHRQVRIYWHCYHDLRHTYAQDMYRIAKTRCAMDGEDPLPFVQIRLGHRDPFTTARIYLWPDLRKLSKIGDHAVAGMRGLIDA